MLVVDSGHRFADKPVRLDGWNGASQDLIAPSFVRRKPQVSQKACTNIDDLAKLRKMSLARGPSASPPTIMSVGNVVVFPMPS
jgi:hypothetical protein